MYKIAEPLLSQDISMGVLPQLYASTAPEAKGGVFYGPKTMRLRGYPAEQKCNDALDDTALLNCRPPHGRAARAGDAASGRVNHLCGT